MTGVVLVGALSLPAYGEVIDEARDVMTIGNGVTYEHILRFTETGWRNIHVTRVDLKSKGIEVEAVTSPRGVSTKANLLEMVNSIQDPVAGINGDFFNLMKTDSPLGLMVNDGAIISSPVLEKPYSTLALSSKGEGGFNTVQCNVTVETATGKTLEIDAYNKITWK